MTKLKLHFDGWMVLPAAIRRRMGVTTGDQLVAEWTDGGLLLRSPTSSQSAVKEPTIEAEPPPADKPKPKVAPKRKPTPTRPNSTGKLAASTIPKARGRRKAAVV